MKEIAGDLHILHISDLHISSAVLGNRYGKLLSDIKKQTKYIKQIILVVTGDIVTKGRLKEYTPAAVKFFSKLKQILGTKVVDVEIVPGNHDITRDYICDYNLCFKDALDGYFILSTQILKLFGIINEGDGNIKHAYGTTMIKYAGKYICFLRIDTSWYIPNNQFVDHVSKCIKETQIEDINDSQKKAEIRRNMDGRVDTYRESQQEAMKEDLNRCAEIAENDSSSVVIEIAIAHHPLSWLLKTPCERYKDFLQSRGLHGIDIWLCGHAHDVQIHYNNDNNQSTILLMTGVVGEETSRITHRYSIYQLNLERNMCAIQIRSAKTDRDFNDDDSLFPTETSKECGHFCYPIKALTPGAVVPLNTSLGVRSKELYVDQNVVTLMRSTVSRMSDLGIRLMELVRDAIIEVYEGMMNSVDLDKEEECIYDAIYGGNTKILKSDWWKSHLMKIDANQILQILLDDICENVLAVIRMTNREDLKLRRTATFDENADCWPRAWRIHFRVLQKRQKGKEPQYKCVAQSGQSLAKDVPWESLIKKAYQHKRKTLIYSANDVDNVIDTDWDDFLTAVLNFDENILKIDSHNMPCITWGVSVKGDTYERRYVGKRILYLLEFFDVNRVLSKAVGEFVRRTGIFLREGILKRGDSYASKTH